jgi:hypothetical protein
MGIHETSSIWKVHLWRNWEVLFLILHSPMTACTSSTKMVITFLLRSQTELSCVGCENRLDNLSNHIAHAPQNKTAKVSHPLEVGSVARKLLLTSICLHHHPSAALHHLSHLLPPPLLSRTMILLHPPSFTPPRPKESSAQSSCHDT